MQQSSRRLAVSVGVLLVVTAVLAVLIVMTLGRSRMWFAKKVTFHAAYPDVAGLREGAAVRLGGRAVGVVTNVTFSQDPRPEAALTVTFRMRADHADRVRADSEAHISTQGLLGDKLLEVTIGSAHEPRVEDGGWIKGVPPADPARLLTLATQTTEDVRDTVAVIRKVADRVDKEVVDETLVTLRSIGKAGERVGRAAAEVERVAGSVDGQALHDASQDLASTAADWAMISRNVAAGKGSLGGLLVDPTLYEETKRLLMNLRRNSIIKTLARLVISKSEPVEIKDANPGNVVIHPRPGPGSRPAQDPRPRKQAKGKRDSVIE